MPSTQINVYSAVPIPRDLSHHIYSSSIADFESKLSDYLLKSYNALSYQRYQRTVKIEEKMEFIYDANYLEIIEDNEKFFAFIDDYLYINDKTVEISYTIDAIATFLWSGKVILGQSFVDRCHSKTDEIGDNLLSEAFGDNLEMVYYRTTESGIVDQEKASIIVQSSVNLNELSNETGFLLEKTFQGIGYFGYKTTEIDDLKHALSILENENKSDGVIKMYMFPSDFYYVIAKQINGIAGKGYRFNKCYDPFGSYVPKNNKIFTYPYNFLVVDNSEGDQIEYHYEYFSTDYCPFYCYPQISGTPSLTLMPNGYYHSPEPSFSISMDDFPQCAWSSDYYKAWLAQNSGAFAVKSLSSLAMALTNSAGIAGSVLLNSASNFVAESLSAKNHAPSVHSSGTNSAFWDMSRKDFYFICKRLNEESARVVDAFWTQYGYPQKKVMDIPLHNRESFTYVKTSGCNAYGNAPRNFIDVIKNAFDSGITFWVNPATMYQYELSNNTL